MSNWLQDLRYGARTLRKSPAFTAAAILTLALGIGANSAIFTLIDAVLLRPLPFPHSDRLVLVWEDFKLFGLKDSPVALGNYTAWRAENHVFGEMGALEQSSFRLTAGAETQQLHGSLATAGLFRALGVQPELGRLFHDGEDQPGASKVVLLSDRLWRSRFGGQASAVDSTVTINDQKCTVVGVMPAGFRFPDMDNELWMPLGSSYRASAFSDRGRHNFMVVARLLPGASLPRANQEIRAIAARMEHDYPDTNAKVGAFVAPLREHFAGEHRSELLVLGCAVGFVLLIACANITNLLLSRAANRKREMAVRAALGASRGRIVRQLFTENLLISAAGGGCGLLIAAYGVRLLQFLVPSGIAAMRPVTVDLRILGFTFAVALLTGVLVGLAPALELLRTDIQRMLKQGGGRTGSGYGARGVERTLVIAEVALAFVLTLGAALMMQAFARLRGVDTGFRTSHLLTLNTPLSRAKYGDLARMNAYYDDVLRRVTALPGVVSAGFANHIPIAFKGDFIGFTIEGRPEPRPGEFTTADLRVITPDYLRTLGIPLRRGRYLNGRDSAGAPSVLLVNETMAREYWPGENAVGKRINMDSDWSTIVGVVADIKTAGLDVPPEPEMYWPAAQVPQVWRAATSLAIHTRGDPAKLAAAVAREIHAVDPGLAITQVSTMEEILDREVFGRRMQTMLLASFAAVALVLAALGIYGVLAYAVAQRTQEIGIRTALGARPADILLSIAAQGMGWSAVGIFIGDGQAGWR